MAAARPSTYIYRGEGKGHPGHKGGTRDTQGTQDLRDTRVHEGQDSLPNLCVFTSNVLILMAQCSVVALLQKSGYWGSRSRVIYIYIYWGSRSSVILRH